MQPLLPDAPDGLELSVVIKTYNEAAKIEGCLTSVVRALEACQVSAEVIVADSVSTDETVQVAGRFPVRLVQFRHASERGCGAGVQLGYQISRGRHVLLLDGDMQLQPAFLPAALEALRTNPRLAGVAGLLLDTRVGNVFDRQRVASAVSSVAQPERWLNGGGLYRRSAIEAAGGYAADRNLKGWEEADLGMRLRASGWQLERIGVEAVRHEGHAHGTLALLTRLWRNGRAAAGGVLLRQAWGQPWFPEALQLMAQPLLTIAWWLVALVCVLAAAGRGQQWPLLVWAALSVAALFAQAIRKRSVHAALVSVCLWHFFAAGLLAGLTLARVNPRTFIDSIELKASPLEPAR